MKPIILISSMLLLNTLVTEVQAAGLCPTTGQVTDATTTTLNNLLSGNTICVLPVPEIVNVVVASAVKTYATFLA